MTRLSARPLTWIVADPAAMLTIVLVVLHQSLIASSAYFLTQTIIHYQEDQALREYLALYLLSIIVPFIPGYLSFMAMQRWINAIHRKFTLAMTSAVYGRLNEYRSIERQSAFESTISKDAFDLISSYAMLSHDLLSLILNSVLSIAVIGMILPSEIALGYGISLALSTAIVCFLAKGTRNLSMDTGRRYASYGDTLHKAWDNAVLGNAYNYDLWKAEFHAQGACYYTSSQRLTTYKQLGNIAIASASLIPTAYLVYHLLVIEQIEAAIIATIIVNLTRIFLILNSLGTLIRELFEWASASARLRYLWAFLLPATTAPLPRAPAGTITLNGEPVSDYQTVRETLRRHRFGRMTLRGENGAGKSALLLSIKQAFAQQAHLLPAGDNQLCWRFKHRNLSAGQRARAIIDEILHQGPDIRYLLLDEWDANLDDDNRKLIDQLLDTLSTERVIIEARHQKSACPTPAEKP
ncbi:ABC transporter ATP-binding protein [Bordetella muralis]|jgi:hypothetical protein|uniref:ATP-binding cassette domain-containing protein n=1 Tax=Bordetella muralis TaxID=1649130 RepID=UPI0039EE9A33